MRNFDVIFHFRAGGAETKFADVPGKLRVVFRLPEIPLIELFFIGEHGIVNKADQPVHVHNGILHGRGREQNLEGVAHGIAQSGGGFVGSGVQAAQMVCFLKNGHIPLYPGNLVRFLGGEIVGGQNIAVLTEGVFSPCRRLFVKCRCRIYNMVGHGEAVFQNVTPLGKQRRRHDQKNIILSLIPKLGDSQ